MPIGIGINGFGRIGRLVYRAMVGRKNLDLKSVNDLTDAKTLATLFKFDSIHGTYKGEVSSEEGALIIDGKRITVTAEKDPTKLDWKGKGVDIAVEATGIFTTKEKCKLHLAAGAKRVLLTAPAKDDVDRTIVVGVNDKDLKPEDLVVSNASCTTNCLAPVAKVLHEHFGIVSGLMTTVHAYTQDQLLQDGLHKDLRRARAAALNVVPTSTGAASALGKVIPAMTGRLHGVAIRVPVPDGSLVDLVARLEKPADVAAINKVFKEAAAGPYKGILRYSEDPIVSSDIVGDPHSSIFDAPQTLRIGQDLVKVMSWYDNEWAFSLRVCDLLERMGAQIGK